MLVCEDDSKLAKEVIKNGKTRIADGIKIPLFNIISEKAWIRALARG